MSDSCDPIDCSPPGSSVHGILQARILEGVAISFSNLALGFSFLITPKEITCRTTQKGFLPASGHCQALILRPVCANRV